MPRPKKSKIARERLLALTERFFTIGDTRKFLERRLPILRSDPNAPICIRCRHCQQTGFLFHCPIYELEEDGKIVGMWGIVYYQRRGHKPITYAGSPMKEEECEAFEPIYVPGG